MKVIIVYLYIFEWKRKCAGFLFPLLISINIDGHPITRG